LVAIKKLDAVKDSIAFYATGVTLDRMKSPAINVNATTIALCWSALRFKSANRTTAFVAAANPAATAAGSLRCGDGGTLRCVTLLHPRLVGVPKGNADQRAKEK
jgi:hypothetical protein